MKQELYNVQFHQVQQSHYETSKMNSTRFYIFLLSLNVKTILFLKFLFILPDSNIIWCLLTSECQVSVVFVLLMCQQLHLLFVKKRALVTLK